MALTKQQQQIRCQIVLDDLLMVEFDDFMYGLDKKNGLMPSHEYNTKLKYGLDNSKKRPYAIT
jgi:hypothetical protein